MIEALKHIEHIDCDQVQTGVIFTPTMSFSGAELVGPVSVLSQVGGRDVRRNVR